MGAMLIYIHTYMFTLYTNTNLHCEMCRLKQGLFKRMVDAVTCIIALHA